MKKRFFSVVFALVLVPLIFASLSFQLPYVGAQSPTITYINECHGVPSNDACPDDPPVETAEVQATTVPGETAVPNKPSIPSVKIQWEDGNPIEVNVACLKNLIVVQGLATGYLQGWTREGKFKAYFSVKIPTGPVAQNTLLGEVAGLQLYQLGQQSDGPIILQLNAGPDHENKTFEKRFKCRV